jgi:hypothetical protein
MVPLPLAVIEGRPGAGRFHQGVVLQQPLQRLGTTRTFFQVAGGGVQFLGRRAARQQALQVVNLEARESARHGWLLKADPLGVGCVVPLGRERRGAGPKGEYARKGKVLHEKHLSHLQSIRPANS